MHSAVIRYLIEMLMDYKISNSREFERCSGVIIKKNVERKWGSTRVQIQRNKLSHISYWMHSFLKSIREAEWNCSRSFFSNFKLFGTYLKYIVYTNEVEAISREY